MKWLSYLEVRPTIQDLQKILKEYNDCVKDNLPESIYILGAGSEGRRLVKECKASGVKVERIFDNDVTKRGRLIDGILIEPFDALLDSSKNIPVVIASHRTYASTISLRSIGYKVTNYAVLQILYEKYFKPHMFYNGLHEDLFRNAHEIIKLSKNLDNIESQSTLNSIIGYRITLDPAVLANTIDWDLYGLGKNIKIGDQEIYVDGGSFDGDSIKIFIDKVCGNYKKIFAFEPDKNNFIKLKENLKNTKNITLINKGLFSKNESLKFINDGSRGAIISEQGDFIIEATSIDEAIENNTATFIKMNIEGAELSALDGAQKTITKSKPKLAISLYHRPADLWMIPKKIKEMNSNYKIYISQHDGGIIESVLYAI